jgi:hypothetical protein
MAVFEGGMKFKTVECRAKSSPNCSKTFKRKIQRGRPQLDCNACKAGPKPAVKSAVTTSVALPVQGNCPCGNTFEIKPGRGRKRTKCDSCRDAGTVYRTNDDGDLEAIRAEALAEEQREIREQNGRDRAARLVEMMKPLLKDTRERKVIVH